MGTAEDMRAMAEALDKVKGSLEGLRLRRENPGGTTEEVSALMARRDLVDAADAVGAGLRRPTDSSLSGSPRTSYIGSLFRNAPHGPGMRVRRTVAPVWGDASPRTTLSRTQTARKRTSADGNVEDTTRPPKGATKVEDA